MMRLQNSTQTYSVILDLAKLKFLNCGVGRLCLHLAHSLLESAPDTLQLRFLLPEDRQTLFPAHRQHCVPLRPWHRERFRAWGKYLGLRPLRGIGCDLWHWTHQDSEYWPPNTRVPVILNVLDLNFLYEGKGPLKTRQRLRRLQTKVNRAHCLIAISQFTAGEVRRHLDIGDKAIHVVPMGVDSPEPTLRDRPAFLPPGEFLYAIGDISPKKNFHVLIGLAEQLPEYRIVIAGRCTSDYARAMRQEIQQRRLEGRILMPGQVNDDERQWLYQNCRAFLFPSLLEGFGLPVIEAMMLGRPVFMSDRTSLPEVGGPLGFYWDTFEPRAMAAIFRQGIQAVQEDPQYHERLRQYAAQFSWQRAARSYLAIYQSVLAEHEDAAVHQKRCA